MLANTLHCLNCYHYIDVSEKSKEDSEIAQPSTEETPMEEGEEMEKEEEMEEEEEDKSSDGFHMCSAGLATRIHNVILRNIIPQLHRCLTQKVGVLLPQPISILTII